MFISRDPIGLMGGSNVFAYAPNPTGWVDPFGLSSDFVPKPVTTGTVYRSGGNTMNTFTPRPSDVKSGFSTFLTKPDKGFAIDVEKAVDAGFVLINDKPNGHVSIKPKNDPDDLRMREWAETKDSVKQGGEPHELAVKLKECSCRIQSE